MKNGLKNVVWKFHPNPANSFWDMGKIIWRVLSWGCKPVWWLIGVQGCSPWFVPHRHIYGQNMTKLKRKPGAFQIYTFQVPTLHSLAARCFKCLCPMKSYVNAHRRGSKPVWWLTRVQGQSHWLFPRRHIYGKKWLNWRKGPILSKHTLFRSQLFLVWPQNGLKFQDSVTFFLWFRVSLGKLVVNLL